MNQRSLLEGCGGLGQHLPRRTDLQSGGGSRCPAAQCSREARGWSREQRAAAPGRRRRAAGGRVLAQSGNSIGSGGALAGAGAGGAAGALQPPLQPPPAAEPEPELLGPPPAYEKAASVGAQKAALPPIKIFVLAILGGLYTGFGGLLVFSVGSACPGMMTSNPGLQKLLMGAFGYPMGLLLALVCGAEVFTGNTALISAAVHEGKATPQNLLTNWVVSYFGNLVGSLMLVAAVASTGLLHGSQGLLSTAVAKSTLTFSQALSRGLLANMLIGLGVWMASATSTLTGKVVAVWFPISAFVACGLEHSVANMFIIPMGMAVGAEVTVRQFLLGNLLPVTLGNTLGGAVCVGTVYALCFGSLGKRLFR